MSLPAQNIDNELAPSFGESYREARRRQRLEVKQMIAGLSQEERKYLGIDGVREEELMQEKPAPPRERRPASRIVELKPAIWKTKQELQEARHAEDLRRIAERNAEEQRRREREAREKERKEELAAILKIRSTPGVKPAPKKFNPLIGEPNARGETPMKLDERTTVLVPAHKDIQAVIDKWLKHFKNS